MWIFGPMMTPLRFGCYVADVNGSKWPCEAMNRKATAPARMLHRRCQRAGAGQRRRDESPRQRSRHECSIADVKVLNPGNGEAMSHRGEKIWRGCPFVAANASRTVPGYKGSRGYLFWRIGDTLASVASFHVEG